MLRCTFEINEYVSISVYREEKKVVINHEGDRSRGQSLEFVFSTESKMKAFTELLHTLVTGSCSMGHLTYGNFAEVYGE